MLRKHLQGEEQQRAIDLSELQLQANITTEETLVSTLAKENKKLRNKMIPLVKVQWNRRGVKEASWEREKNMRGDYPQLFEDEV